METTTSDGVQSRPQDEISSPLRTAASARAIDRAIGLCALQTKLLIRGASSHAPELDKQVLRKSHERIVSVLADCLFDLVQDLATNHGPGKSPYPQEENARLRSLVECSHHLRTIASGLLDEERHV